MPLYIIAAIDSNRGIGLKNSIPWNLKNDMKFFKEKTEGNVVIMGNNTFESLPEKNKPLKNRFNIVITNNKNLISMKMDLAYYDMHRTIEYIKRNSHKDIYIIGGEKIYNYFINLFICDDQKIFLTVIDKKYGCDKKFPYISNNYKITNYSDKFFDETEKVSYRNIEYTYTKSPCQNENIYLNLARDILKNGNKRPDRTHTGTLGVFSRQLRFNITDSFPLLTTKRVGIKLTIEELLWFLRGDTNSKILEERGVNIWKLNTTREFLDKRGLTEYPEGDIGCGYGFQWRHWNAKYIDCNTDYTGKGIDQLTDVINLLKNDPFNRRIIISDWNVSDLDKMCLPPCHGNIINFYVEERDNKKYLSLMQTQRSVDTLLGLPVNIASYSILLYIIALKVDMVPYEVIINTADTHIYLNHIEQIKEQLTREVLCPSVLKLNKEIHNKDWKDITVDDFELIGYNCWPSIKAEMAI